MQEVRDNAEDVVKWFPELGGIDWEGDRILWVIGNMIEHEMDNEKEARIGRWETKMEHCERGLIDWIRQEEDVEGWSRDRYTSAQQEPIQLDPS